MQQAAVLYGEANVSDRTGEKELSKGEVVRTYSKPRLMSAQRPALIRVAIWTFHSSTIGKRASRKSETMEMIP